jgi:hypothetical protein
MLGRLEMDIGDCISAYTDLMETVFTKQLGRSPLSFTGTIRSRFDTKKLKSAVEQVIIRIGASVTDLFNDGRPHRCRV